MSVAIISTRRVRPRALPSRSDGTASRRRLTLHVMGEVDALEKVAFNYLSNGKYTPKEGSIALGLEARDQSAALRQRHGPGISVSRKTLPGL